MSADVKCKFSELKYEELIAKKYFIKTCSSKEYESYSLKERIKDLYMKIKFSN